MVLWITNMLDLKKTFCHRKQSQTPGELTSFLKEVQLPLIPTVPSGVTHSLSPSRRHLRVHRRMHFIFSIVSELLEERDSSGPLIFYAQDIVDTANINES